MPQSLAKLYVHLTFSTKNREPWLKDDFRDELHAVMGDMESPALIINSVEDHIHALIVQSKNESLKAILNILKTNSSKWLRAGPLKHLDFHWQNGYGGFSVSRSGVEDVTVYIANQREHHRKKSFQEEFRQWLTKYEIEYDERYVWD